MGRVPLYGVSLLYPQRPVMSGVSAANRRLVWSLKPCPIVSGSERTVWFGGLGTPVFSVVERQDGLIKFLQTKNLPGFTPAGFEVRPGFRLGAEAFAVAFGGEFAVAGFLRLVVEMGFHLGNL